MLVTWRLEATETVHYPACVLSIVSRTDSSVWLRELLRDVLFIYGRYGISVPDDLFSLLWDFCTRWPHIGWRVFTVPMVKFSVECFLDLSLSLWFMVVGCDCRRHGMWLPCWRRFINKSLDFLWAEINWFWLAAFGVLSEMLLGNWWSEDAFRRGTEAWMMRTWPRVSNPWNWTFVCLLISRLIWWLIFW